MSDDDASEMSGLWRGIMSAELAGGVLFAVLALAIGLTLWSHRTVLGKDAGVTLLVVLMALKTICPFSMGGASCAMTWLATAPSAVTSACASAHAR